MLVDKASHVSMDGDASRITMIREGKSRTHVYSSEDESACSIMEEVQHNQRATSWLAGLPGECVISEVQLVSTVSRLDTHR